MGVPHLIESHELVSAACVTAPLLRSVWESLCRLKAAAPPAQLPPCQAHATRMQYGKTRAQLIAVTPGAIVDEE